jgi:acyl-CoA thioester hydrolase
VVQKPAVVTSRTQIIPRYSETNQSGFVGESSYLRWLDLARTLLLKEQGMDYREFETLGYLMPVLEISLTFHQPARYDDTLWIVTALRKRPTFRIRLDYEIWRESILLATGHSVQGFVNRKHRPVKPPPRLAARLDVLFPGFSPAGLAIDQNSTAGP